VANNIARNIQNKAKIPQNKTKQNKTKQKNKSKGV